MKQRLALALQVAGGLALTAAGFIVGVVAGFAVLGVSLIVFGVAVERDDTESKQ